MIRNKGLYFPHQMTQDSRHEEMADIPSPEQIKAILDARHAGKPIAMLEDINALQKKVDKLGREVSKKRTAKDMREALDLLREKHDFSAAEELIELAMELRGKPLLLNLRVKILETLLEYEVPKLKSVEVTGEVEHSHTITIVRYGEDGSIRQEKLQDPGSVKVLAAPVTNAIEAEVAT